MIPQMRPTLVRSLPLESIRPERGSRSAAEIESILDAGILDQDDAWEIPIDEMAEVRFEVSR